MLRKESSPRPILEAAEDGGHGPAIAVLAASGAIALFAVSGQPTRQHIIHLLDDDNTAANRNLRPARTLHDPVSIPAFGKLPSEVATPQHVVSPTEHETPKQTAVSFSPEIQRLLAAQKDLSQTLWGDQRPFAAPMLPPPSPDQVRNSTVASNFSKTDDIGHASSAIEQALGAASLATVLTEDASDTTSPSASENLGASGNIAPDAVSLKSLAKREVLPNATSPDGSQAPSLAAIQGDGPLPASAKTPSAGPASELPVEPRDTTEPASSVQIAPATPVLSQACLDERCLSPQQSFAPTILTADALANLAHQAATVTPVMPAARAMASNAVPSATPVDRFPHPQF
ncbi:hypothetical protein [Novosphingobium olei]|uniref:Uncharacterized protein n=1 Tax=Novosphingobium olei TaxID=2728851 RepID=A0A7Y0BSE2_9SPHN|nr:hypothetical protein [Novosphingobium olei]NML95687.1 hypothetical protein [Novosphingobium olei]